MDQSSIWMLRRGLPIEYSYSIKDSFYLKMCVSFLFFFFLQKVGTVFQITHQLEYIFLSSFSFFFFDRRIYESVNIFSLLLSTLQGYSSIEHLYLADSLFARVGS